MGLTKVKIKNASIYFFVGSKYVFHKSIYTITCNKLVQKYMMYNADREAVIVQKTQSHWTIIPYRYYL